MLVVQEAADGALEVGGGLGGAGECQSWFGDLCEFVQKMLMSEQLLEATENSGRGWDGLLEVRRSSGDNLEEQSCLGARRSCRGSPEKKHYCAVVLACCGCCGGAGEHEGDGVEVQEVREARCGGCRCCCDLCKFYRGVRCATRRRRLLLLL